MQEIALQSPVLWLLFAAGHSWSLPASGNKEHKTAEHQKPLSTYHGTHDSYSYPLWGLSAWKPSVSQTLSPKPTRASGLHGRSPALGGNPEGLELLNSCSTKLYILQPHIRASKAKSCANSPLLTLSRVSTNIMKLRLPSNAEVSTWKYLSQIV